MDLAPETAPGPAPVGIMDLAPEAAPTPAPGSLILVDTPAPAPAFVIELSDEQEELCQGRTVVSLEALGVTVFDGETFATENPDLDVSGGLCIIGTDLADNISGTEFNDVIFGGKGE